MKQLFKTREKVTKKLDDIRREINRLEGRIETARADMVNGGDPSKLSKAIAALVIQKEELDRTERAMVASIADMEREITAKELEESVEYARQRLKEAANLISEIMDLAVELEAKNERLRSLHLAAEQAAAGLDAQKRHDVLSSTGQVIGAVQGIVDTMTRDLKAQQPAFRYYGVPWPRGWDV